ncbi:hypothetical protein BJ508DRAFT_412574 [Ascobolus immersus RN42]|uniref:DUF7580 domain-containing protein n=1 Tax=Ascobolus immersus RN42 TaxID=1160509 RepID=A0A3N4IFV2_ASCIM|nr:hypothetical protein BJ508DRAFT_412574 [Ascobolus immersus RN42]
MSGFEVAGLVLGILPILSEAGQAASGYIRNFQKAASKREFGASLGDFYEEFHWETYQLEETLRKIFEYSLPGTGTITARIHEDPTGLYWPKDKLIEDALSRFFNRPSEREIFERALKKVFELFLDITKEKTFRLGIGTSSTDRARMSQLMQEFEMDRRNGRLDAKFLQRYRFFEKEKNRVNCMKTLTKWNERLATIVKRRTPAKPSDTDQAVCVASPGRRDLRLLARKMFGAFSQCWKCSCPDEHQATAKFCLANCTRGLAATSKAPTNDIEFDLLMLVQSLRKDIDAAKWERFEATVVLRAKKLDGEGLKMICEAITNIPSMAFALSFPVEDLGQMQKVLHPTIRPEPPRYAEESPITLAQLLKEPRPSLIIRREIAMTLAYALLQLHDNPCAGSQWDKSNIQFFRTQDGYIDFKRPYIDTTFHQIRSACEPVDRHLFHKNLGILKLGILLIEVDSWKAIEEQRREVDMKDGVIPNVTDLFTALRILRDGMGECYEMYKKSVQACLEMSWVPAGEGVSLDDEGTRESVYKEIIEPLYNEYSFGSGSQFS